MKGSFRNSCNVLRFRVAGRRVKRFPFFTNELDLLAQGPEVQSQWVSKKLTCTVALQRAQSAQETMICSFWDRFMYNAMEIKQRLMDPANQNVLNCGFCSNRILHFFPLFVRVSVTGVKSHISRIYKGINAV